MHQYIKADSLEVMIEKEEVTPLYLLKSRKNRIFAAR